MSVIAALATDGTAAGKLICSTTTPQERAALLDSALDDPAFADAGGGPLDPLIVRGSSVRDINAGHDFDSSDSMIGMRRAGRGWCIASIDEVSAE